jgi:hypothetical protein
MTAIAIQMAYRLSGYKKRSSTWFLLETGVLEKRLAERNVYPLVYPLKI